VEAALTFTWLPHTFANRGVGVISSAGIEAMFEEQDPG
jgi:hypothetical protein